MKKFFKFFKILICAILCRCPECFTALDCIRHDYGGLFDGYGHYYCPKCCGPLKEI